MGRQRVGLFSADSAIGGSAPRDHPIATTTTALDGSFTFTDVAPGHYLVSTITPASFNDATSRRVIVTTTHGAVVTLLLCPECRAAGSG